MISRIDRRFSDWNAEHNSPNYGLSVSLGFAVFEQGKDLIEVVKEADSRIYENKLKQKSKDVMLQLNQTVRQGKSRVNLS